MQPFNHPVYQVCSKCVQKIVRAFSLLSSQRKSRNVDGLSSICSVVNRESGGKVLVHPVSPSDYINKQHQAWSGATMDVELSLLQLVNDIS